jgi:hypothetical protein
MGRTLPATPAQTLFAALDVLTGKVIGQCLPRHRHTEFLKFLRTIDLASCSRRTR